MKSKEKPAVRGKSDGKSDKASKAKAAPSKAAPSKAAAGKAKKSEKAEKETKPAAKPAKAPAKKPPAKVESKSKPPAKGKKAPVAVADSSAAIAAENAEALAVAAAQAAAAEHDETTQIAVIPHEAPPAELSEEERELTSLYQGDLEAPSLAHGEFKDQKTADEDRPMLPEINARDERRRGWEDRRERRRQEREQRRLARRDGHRGQQGSSGGGNAGSNGQSRPAHGAPAGSQVSRNDRGASSGGGSNSGGPGGQQSGAGQPERNERNDRGERNERNDRSERNERSDRGERNDRGERSFDRDRNQGQDRSGSFSSNNSGAQGAQGANASAPSTISASSSSPSTPVEPIGLGSPMAGATAALFAQLRNAQPLPVKQLAAMLRKRGLIEGEPDLVWPQLRAELLSDERAFRSLGLRPRVVHRGRDLFAPGPSFSDHESQLVASVAGIQAATAKTLAGWVAQASPAAFERLIHSYLVAVGYRDVNWVKRVDGIAYAQATAPGIERSVLVSARSGSVPIDRRGIGELRVGVEAKGLPFGYLFSAATLSSDAERELERPGRSISVVCGDALVAALMSAGIGVAATAVSVRFVDEHFLEDLSAG